MGFHWSLSNSKSHQVSRIRVCYYYYHYYLFIRVFHISVSWWSFTEVWDTVLYTHLQHHNDTTIKTDAWIKDAGRKTQEGKRRKKTSLPIYFTSHFIARVRKGFSMFACERVLETEHKLNILTPLLWPSRCVFLVLLMLGSTPSGVSKGPLGRVWLSLPHLVSSCLEFYWQLLLGLELNWVK